MFANFEYLYLIDKNELIEDYCKISNYYL